MTPWSKAILALIGLVLLIAPHFMGATPLRDMFAQPSGGLVRPGTGPGLHRQEGLHRLRQRRG
jgi:hypothetical protein